eukprot:CAMPEP_0172456042 /NCGR_PEP_ID=MMETSP1065-20121228/13861_1 /TAXON_ID=265537 /ORGANISM="Amphiprora paludosa, Strain CCMP125" /LENGTH=48 /DNA_ID= /DNA_START= /DNA_END= /DNA_ORIENTATION=
MKFALAVLSLLSTASAFTTAPLMSRPVTSLNVASSEVGTLKQVPHGGD